MLALRIIIQLTIAQYSMYGHVEKLAFAELAGIKKAGGTATIYQQVNTINNKECHDSN
jgi:NAD(P)H dehydrogenase (quinone)